MDIKTGLEQKKTIVEKSLDLLLSEEKTPLFEAMRYTVLSGGKRYRPLLLLSTNEFLGGALDTALPFACALEFIHNYSLIHDDLPCMDDDDLRRGKPTCHKVYGEAIAVLAGDGLLSLAFEIMGGADLLRRQEAVRGEIIRTVARLAGPSGMVGGQALDINMDPAELTGRDYNILIEKKTGGLILAAIISGALLGGAGAGERAALEAYGRHLGMAFQLRDDILDSQEDAVEKEQHRPNSTTLFGPGEAFKRFEHHLGCALASLDDLNSRPDELVYLGEMLHLRKEGHSYG